MAHSGLGLVTSDNTDLMVFEDHPPILRKDINDTEWTNTKAVLITFMSIINVFMFFGNTLSIVAICYTKKLRQQVSYWFVLNLAVIDLIISVTVVPINTIWEYYGTWPFNQTTCEFFTFADISFSTISAYSIVLVSIDKYVYISYSIHYYEKMTRKIALIMIGGVWTMVFIFAMVSILTKVGTDKYYEDHFLVLPNNTHICVFVMTDAYVLPSVIFSFFIPFLILCFTSSRITCIASKHIKKIHTITISITTETDDSQSIHIPDKTRPRRHTITGFQESKSQVKTIGFRKISSEKNVFPSNYQSVSKVTGETNFGCSINDESEISNVKETQQSENFEMKPKEEVTETFTDGSNRLKNGKISQANEHSTSYHSYNSRSKIPEACENISETDSEKLNKVLHNSADTSTDNRISDTEIELETDSTKGPTERNYDQSKSNEVKGADNEQSLDIPETRVRSESMRSQKLKQSDSIKSVFKKTSPYCKLFGTVTIVIACFILMFAPYNIATVIDVPCHCIEPWVYEDILAVLYYMHSLVNPYIYMATDRKYKAALKVLWKKIKKKFMCIYY